MSSPRNIASKFAKSEDVFNGYDCDDEVFIEEDHGDEGVELRDKNDQPRVRRVSDVIDSIGDMSPIQRTLIDTIESMDGRRLSDPLGLQVRQESAPLRHSDSFAALNGSQGRPQSIFVDQGYGSSSTVSPSYLVYPHVPSLRSAVNITRRKAADTIDAQPYNVPTSSQPIEATMPVEKDSEEYNMNHTHRGKAIIFNHDTFDIDGINPRNGSDIDVKKLVQTYESLGFEPVVHDNLTLAEIKQVISTLSGEDFTDSDCLCVTVLTHGLGTNYLLSKDCPYGIDLLWAPFTADRCTTLAGKPKLFFIQACRGERLDSGVTLVQNRSRTETDSSASASPSYKIPSQADFLMAYSSVEGFFSWRNPEDGTWFIQCLCDELQKNAANLDLQKILTRVSRKVALDYQSYNDLIPWQHEQKQVPSVVSMLIRDVNFRPKK